MLYDNAQLGRVYLHAWQVSGNEFFRTITEEILDYVMREMTDPAGGFYSTQDANSEGEEGKFFVWTPDEIRLCRDGADAQRPEVKALGPKELADIALCSLQTSKIRKAFPHSSSIHSRPRWARVSGVGLPVCTSQPARR